MATPNDVTWGARYESTTINTSAAPHLDMEAIGARRLDVDVFGDLVLIAQRAAATVAGDADDVGELAQRALRGDELGG